MRLWDLASQMSDMIQPRRISFSNTRLWQDDGGLYSVTSIRNGVDIIGAINGVRHKGAYVTHYTVECPDVDPFTRPSLNAAKQELLDRLGAVKVFLKPQTIPTQARNLMERQRESTPLDEIMSGPDIQRARVRLGNMWLDRPLRQSELARILRVKGRDPGAIVHDWEAGKRKVPFLVGLAVELMLSGARPPTLDAAIKLAKGPVWDVDGRESLEG